MSAQKIKTQIMSDSNFKVFTKEFAKVNYEIAKMSVKESECSVAEIKGLTSNIMQYVSDDENTDLMNHIASVVEHWNNDKTLVWKKALTDYARTQEDIREIYYETKDGASRFLIVTEVTGGEILLQHNDFSFELFDRYDDISDFMVLDEGEFSSMKEYYLSYTRIYQRG